MILLPAIDVLDGKVVRLLRGDYDAVTVYSDDPVATARRIGSAGAEWLHVVDLRGAKDGSTPALGTVSRIVKETSLKVEVGGGIRDMDAVDRYISAGVRRVILGTAALRDRCFLVSALDRYGDRIAVGVDARDGRVAVSGWLETTQVDLFDFVRELEKLGVSTVICTDIARDGAMKGVNSALYARLKEETKMNVTASGGVSSYDDIRALRDMGLYGAILGRAMYDGSVALEKALEAAR